MKMKDVDSAKAVIIGGWIGPVLCWLCSLFHKHLDQWVILAIGIVSLVGIVLYVYSQRDKTKPVEPMYIIFSICTFSSCVDLLIGLESDGWIKGWVDFYLKDGEPYLTTAYGAMINFWDFFGHYSMYLAILWYMCYGGPVRNVCLFWVGSIFHSLLVFLPGNVFSKDGVRMSYLLNVPYVIVPLYVLYRVRNSERLRYYLGKKAKETLCSNIIRRPFDCLLLIYLSASFCLAIIRGFAALDCNVGVFRFYRDEVEPYMKDPVTYPKLQMLVYLFYFSVIYCLSGFALLIPGCSWAIDLALVHAGAAAQAQFSHIGGSINWKTEAKFRPQSQGIFWFVNLMLLLGPLLYLMRVLHSPHYFLTFVRKTEREKS